jgi:adenosine deaminase CECR1
MVGSPTMNIHGWRQLAEWSIEYSCLNEADQAKGRAYFEADWDVFCDDIIQKYGAYADTLTPKPKLEAIVPIALSVPKA